MKRATKFNSFSKRAPKSVHFVLPWLSTRTGRLLAQYKPFTAKEWFLLPLGLRQRWWNETNQSRTLPSRELVSAIETALGEVRKNG